MTAERAFKAMGAQAHVLVVADNLSDHDHLLDYAQDRITTLVAKWSRLHPTSELRRLNSATGRPVVVSQDTFDLIAHAVDGWHLTAGRYNPTFDIEKLDADGPGCAEVVLTQSVNTVHLPARVQLDLDGIDRGYAADLVTAELLALGARGALVSIGGAFRCAGTAPWDVGWLIEIEDPNDPAATAATLGLADGAVVTAADLPTRSPLTAATVVAGEAWWAEVLAKASFSAGAPEGLRLLSGLGVTGILFDDEGNAHNVDRLEAFSR